MYHVHTVYIHNSIEKAKGCYTKNTVTIGFQVHGGGAVTSYLLLLYKEIVRVYTFDSIYAR